MPGIISTVTTQSGTSTSGTEAGTFFVAGITERGRTDVLGTVRSIADYARLYGSRVTYGSLYDSLRVFFEEGGSVAKVARVVGGTATVGNLTLQDVSPADSVTLTAKGAGIWSSNVDVIVADGSLSGTFKITLTYGSVVETYDNLSDSADAVQKINLRSVLVTATDEGGGVPVNGTFNLSAGDDDRAAITATDYTDQLTALADATTAPGAVAIPGQTASAVGAALLTYAETNRKVAILSPAITADAATAISDAAALIDTAGAEYGTLVFPSITINHNGALVDVSPEGYVAGVRARAIREDGGPWRAPAGEIARSRSIVEPTVEVDQSTGNDLDASGVSAIRTIYGSPRLYGWRSLSSNVEDYGLLTNADTINYVLDAVERVMEEFVFEPIDGRGQLFSSLKGAVIGELQPITDAGGLYAKYDGDDLIDPGYSVTTDETVNTEQTIAQNKLRVDVAIRPSPSAALIEFNLTKVSLTSAV